MRHFIASLHLTGTKRAMQSIGGPVWRLACRQWTGGRRSENGVCVFPLPTFRSHFWPWVQGFRCLQEIRLLVIDEFVPVSAGGSLWFPRTPSHWTELSSGTSEMGRKIQYRFLPISQKCLRQTFLSLSGFPRFSSACKYTAASFQQDNKILQGFSRPCRKVLCFTFSPFFPAIRQQVSEPGAVSTMAFLTLLLSPWRRHGNLSSERAQRGSISTRLISPHTRLPAYCLLVLSPCLY